MNTGFSLNNAPTGFFTPAIESSINNPNPQIQPDALQDEAHEEVHHEKSLFSKQLRKEIQAATIATAFSTIPVMGLMAVAMGSDSHGTAGGPPRPNGKLGYLETVYPCILLNSYASASVILWPASLIAPVLALSVLGVSETIGRLPLRKG